ncbi:MAG: hypothetical protein ACFFDH_02825 [Promethearchaeota archaeon]
MSKDMEKLPKDIEEVEKWVEKERKTLENEDREKKKKPPEKKKQTLKEAVLEWRKATIYTRGELQTYMFLLAIFFSVITILLTILKKRGRKIFDKIKDKPKEIS